MNSCTPLAAYKLFLHAPPCQWLGSLRNRLTLEGFDFCQSPPPGPMPLASHLGVKDGRITYFILTEATCVRGLASRLTLVRVCSGRLRGYDPIFLMPAGTEFSWRTDATTRLTIIEFDGQVSTKVEDRALSQTQMETVGQCLDDYLRSSRFFFGHQQAVRNSQYLLRRLLKALRYGMPRPDIRARLVDDANIERLIHRFARDKDWAFNLPDIASALNVSERSVYYRVKRTTGLTPYRLYRHCKLVELRDALLHCDCQGPSPTWHALDHGFNHLGRLPALYRHHFGERLQDTIVRDVEPVAGQPLQSRSGNHTT